MPNENRATSAPPTVATTLNQPGTPDGRLDGGTAPISGATGGDTQGGRPAGGSPGPAGSGNGPPGCAETVNWTGTVSWAETGGVAVGGGGAVAGFMGSGRADASAGFVGGGWAGASAGDSTAAGIGSGPPAHLPPAPARSGRACGRRSGSARRIRRCRSWSAPPGSMPYSSRSSPA